MQRDTRFVDSRIHDISGRDLLFTRDFTAEELRGRRQTIAAQIGEGAHLLIVSAPPMSGDRAVQDALFYYFCGLETCHSYLLVDGGSGRTSLFLPSRTTMAGEDSNKLGFEDAELIKQRLLVDAVRSSTELTAALSKVKCLYTPHAELEGGGSTRFAANGVARRREEEEWDQAEPRHKRLIRLLGERFPGLEVLDVCPLVDQMRKVKSTAEINLLREAGKISADVMVESMKITCPGVTENQLQAVAEQVFRERGHCGLGYGVIAASGKRTWDGHYHFNNATLRDGEVVLMDCGPDLRHYTSDIARIWPVNGVFSEWHRNTYGFIVAYHKTLISLIRPGVLAKDIYSESARIMAEACKDPASPFGDQTAMLEQMVAKGVGYLNHAVGLSVHDAAGSWHAEPLQPGVVCVVDPMIWCEPQHEYIRVEDTVVVTADGCERLTGDAPIEIDEIEALMRG